MVLGSVLALSWPLPAWAGDIFYWVDKKGGVHFSDQLHSVPEPYFSAYKARIAEREEKRKQQEQERAAAGIVPAKEPEVVAPQQPSTPAPEEPTGPRLSQQIRQKQEDWRKLMKESREELLAATEGLRKAEDEMQALEANPVLVHTPQVKAQIPAAENRYKEARERVERARKALLTDLPARAKKEHVPPKWLE